ncbi:MAG: D-glycero-beta-D-manno-heptose-7-phosphate kinase [Chryseobacterium sp.]|nr:D-glycero-beta-D-manno-heptose-7-phosphate kinase [Chryseobacterium sp.]
MMSKLFPQQNKILIIGDAILDVYYLGKVDRVSPEAPVPVVQVQKTIKMLGGAANVANNIGKLNGSASLIGFSGKDLNCKILQDLLDENNISHTLIETQCPTITKIRVVSGVQQIVRVDFEEKISTTEELEELKLHYLENDFKDCDVIILSDYGKGFVTEKFSRHIIDKANIDNKPIIIDPKGKDWEKYRNATIVTPNVKELGEVVGYSLENEDAIIEKAGLEIKAKYNFQNLLVTRSEKGMTFFANDSIEHIRTTATEVFDVSGAGDTVVATLARALASGYSWIDGVKLANKAAGIVVSKIGTEPITYRELENSIEEFREENKIIETDLIENLMGKLKSKNKKIVFTNGCFDIIHKGHIKYLQEARKKGDILVVGLNSDNSVKRLKGPERPIKNQEERALIMSALEMVDYVSVFDEDTPIGLIQKVAPDVLVKGGDYKVEEIIGREYAKETIIIPFVNGYSTTSTIDKIKTS